MKIGLITTMFEQEYKSVTYVELAKRYIERGHEVHVIGKREKNQLPYEKVNGIVMHRVNVPSFPGAETLLPIFAKKILQELDGYVDIFDLHDFHGFGLRKIIKKPYVVQIPSTLTESVDKLKSVPWRDSSFRSLISRYFFGPYVLVKAQSYACEGAKMIIAICENTKNRIVRDYKVNEEKITVIPAGVDINQFNPNNSGKIWRDKLSICDEKIILYVGVFTYLKGIDFMIHASKKVIDAHKNAIVVVLAGKGTKAEEERLYRIITSLGLENKVIFTGWVGYEDLPYLYAASDILVHPSLVEGTPLVILEAMATGKPVIATKVGGVPDMIADGVDGFIIEEKNAGQIAEKVLVLIEDEMLCKKFGENARKKIEEKFDWDLIAKRILNVYGEVIRNPE